MTKPAATVEQVADYLTRWHHQPVKDVVPLAGGFWSAAFGYTVDDRELVFRLGTIPEGFEADRAAMEYNSPELPVPEILHIGEAIGWPCAISVRHHGRFLESIEPSEADVTRHTVGRLLGALRAAPKSGQPTHEPRSWRRWLLSGLVDDPTSRTAGWRRSLAADSALNALFVACERRVTELVEACPERRDLVHGDLLHGNVLLTPDGAAVSAVFSWKCSVRGDFLFDTAWCTFWGPWHPGVASAEPWEATVTATDLTEADLTDAAVRHHCYELQIGASHFGWYLWTQDKENLRKAAMQAAQILERGPLH